MDNLKKNFKLVFAALMAFSLVICASVTQAASFTAP